MSKFGVKDSRFESRGTLLEEPIPLLDWCRDKEFHPGEQMRYERACWSQVLFVRDTLASLLFPGALSKEKSFVVGHHLSKSIQLPVYELRMGGWTALLRNNFHDWKVTIETIRNINVDPGDLFDPKHHVPAIYCEGFLRDRVYGAYNDRMKNDGNFTIAIGSNHRLYTFLWLIQNQFAQSAKE